MTKLREDYLIVTELIHGNLIIEDLVIKRSECDRRLNHQGYIERHLQQLIHINDHHQVKWHILLQHEGSHDQTYQGKI